MRLSIAVFSCYVEANEAFGMVLLFNPGLLCDPAKEKKKKMLAG